MVMIEGVSSNGLHPQDFRDLHPSFFLSRINATLALILVRIQILGLTRGLTTAAPTGTIINDGWHGKSEVFRAKNQSPTHR